MLNKLIALFATGAPGASRFIFATLIGILFGPKVIVDILSDFALIIALQMISIQGFSLLLLKNNSPKENVVLIHLSYLFAVLGVVVIAVLHMLEVINYLYQSIILYLGMVGYQNIRSRSIKAQRFKQIVRLESFLLSSFLIVCFFTYHYNLNRESQFIYLLFSFMFFGYFVIDFKKAISEKVHVKYWPQMIQQGLLVNGTNFLTGGVIWLMPKISILLFSSAQISTLTSLVFLFGLVSLIPRTFLNMNIKNLNFAVEVCNFSKIKQLNRNLIYFLILLFPVFILISVGYLILVGVELSNSVQSVVGIVFFSTATLLISQSSLISSMVMTLMHKNVITLKYNLVYFSLLLLGALSLLLVKSQVGESTLFFYGFYLMMFMSLLVRNTLLNKSMVKEFEK